MSIRSYSFTLVLAFICFTSVALNGVNAQNASDVFKRGEAALAARDYNLAITEFTQYIQQMPKSSAAYFNRAIAYKALNNRELAVEDLSKAIELKPGYSKYFITRGLIYKELGRDDLSLGDYSKVLELEPKNVAAHVNRGEIYLNRRQLDEALSDITQAIHLDDKAAKAYWVRSNIFTIQAQWDQAIQDMKRALVLDPSQKSLYHTLAWMEMHVGNNSSANEAAVKFLDAFGMKHNRSGWTLVAGYLALLREGSTEAAENFIKRYPREEAEGFMPRKALEYLRGNLSDIQLLAEAGDDEIKRTDSRAIIGLKLLIDGRTADAMGHLSWVKDYGKKGPTTYALALVELKKLSSKRSDQ